MKNQKSFERKGKNGTGAASGRYNFKQFIFTLLIATGILFMIDTGISKAVPSYSRQTGLACAACHTTFPELNSFGRLFKLNGYTLTNIKTIGAPVDSVRSKLNLLTTPPIAGMVMSSFTSVSKKQPGTQNNNVDLPQQLSLFYSGQVTPHIGTFIQLTYDPQDGFIGMDNTDIRYANHLALGSKDLIYGLTLNNNPSVQDVWNTTPAWHYPYSTSGEAPSPSAATMIDGGLAQAVAGLGTYGLFNNLLYYEISLYRSAPQGAANPPDSSSFATISGLAPYWRVALQHQFMNQYLMLGTYGMSAKLYPQYASGTVDHYNDIGFDLQYECALQNANLSLHSTLIRENRKLNATFADGGADLKSSKLNTFRIDGSVYLKKGAGLTLGYFDTSGDKDMTFNGTYNGKPNSNGAIMELTFLPWYNTRFSVQYVMYGKFDGQSTNYDGAFRNASQNNTLYCLAWISF